MDASAVVGFTSATLLGLMANQIVKRLVKSDQMLDGFQRRRWVLSVFTQAIIFPTILLLAWCYPSKLCSLDAWFRLPASQLAGFERWYVYALFASQSRDMIPRMPAATSTTMKVHHWVVVIACLLALNAHAGFGIFVAGTFALECGSMTFNMRVLYPESRAVECLYQACMLLSNVVAVALGFVMLRVENIDLWMRVLFFAADVGVCIGRQHHALKDCGLLKSSHSSKGVAGGARQSCSPSAATSAAAFAGRRKTSLLRATFLFVAGSLGCFRYRAVAAEPKAAAPAPPETPAASPPWPMQRPPRAGGLAAFGAAAANALRARP